MTYSKTAWVDNVTPVDAARMNKVEQGIADAEDLVYQGDYSAATAYNDGDIVVYNGVVYLCVKPVTGQAPVGWPATPTAAVSYGTTLPASPVDGQEAILVDSTTNPSYQWRFRYNAGSSSPYKWEFVGGSWARQEISTQESWTTINAMQDLATPGPLVVLPRSGDYLVRGGAMFSSSVSDSFYLQLFNGTTSGLGVYAAGSIAAAGVYTSLGVANRGNGLASGTDARLRYQHSTTGTASAMQRWIEVQPVRVA